MTSPHVIFAKFRVEVSSPGVPESHPTSSSPMIPELWNDPWSGGTIPQETDNHLWGRRESKEDIKQQRRNTAEGCDRSRRGSFPKEDQYECRLHCVKDESLWFDINIGDSTQGTWVVLDTLDDFGTYILSPPAGRSLTTTFLSILKPSASTTPMFTGHYQLYFGAQQPTSRLGLFLTFFHLLTSIFPHQQPT